MLGWMLALWVAYEWEMEERRMKIQMTQTQINALAAQSEAARIQLEAAGMLSPTGRTKRYDPPIQMIPVKTGRVSYKDVPRANIPKWMKPEDKIEIRYLLKGLVLKGLGSILGSASIKKSAQEALDKAEPYGKDIRPR